jgi:hypothetical protein
VRSDVVDKREMQPIAVRVWIHQSEEVGARKRDTINPARISWGRTGMAYSNPVLCSSAILIFDVFDIVALGIV